MMDDTKIPVVLVANARYRPGLEATRYSIEKSCSNPERLVFYEFDDRAMQAFSSRASLRPYHSSTLPYLRLFLEELLPDCDWVAYADVDTLWFRDICELWLERDDAVSVCWTRDYITGADDFMQWVHERNLPIERPSNYACSGIALFNLKKWRNENFSARAVEFIQQYGCSPYPDQDVLNVLLANDAKILSQNWNRMIPSYFYHPCVIHITGLGKRLFGQECYDATIPQDIFWRNYVNKCLNGKGNLSIPVVVFVKLLSWAICDIFISPILLFTEPIAHNLHIAVYWMRMRRKFAFSRFFLLHR